MSAHRRLDVLFTRAHDAVGGSRPAAAVRAVARLREALEAHFLQEESLYYPPILTLRPETRPALEQALAAHAGFRTTLGEIAALLERGDHAAAARRLKAFSGEFSRHEAAEEGALATLGDAKT